MKAISLWQPWASAMALGVKRNETRHWATNYRGPIAIHAAQRDTPDLRIHFAHLLQGDDFMAVFTDAALYNFSFLPKGAVVAVAELVEVVPTEMLVRAGRVRGLEEKLGDYTPGRFAWRFEDIRRLDQPYVVTGRQGLFEVPDELQFTNTETNRSDTLPPIVEAEASPKGLGRDGNKPLMRNRTAK